MDELIIGSVGALCIWVVFMFASRTLPFAIHVSYTKMVAVYIYHNILCVQYLPIYKQNEYFSKSSVQIGEKTRGGKRTIFNVDGDVHRVPTLQKIDF